MTDEQQINQINARWELEFQIKKLCNNFTIQTGNTVTRIIVDGIDITVKTKEN